MTIQQVSRRASRLAHVETDLIEAAKRMDPLAWDELYSEHHLPIFRYVFVRTRSAPVSEDITADVFLEAVRGIRRYQHRGAPFRAWLYRIAHNLTVDHHKRTVRTVESLDGGRAAALHYGGDVPLRVAERDALRGAISRLTPEQQQVVILRFIEGLSLEEVGAVTRRPKGSVKSMQHRALRRLRAILEEDNYVEL
ncbi:MAG TPA: RNA polymerase sigma factor [Tepidiformaceae bacterium]|nr:RNA polymerase sigma factor [Tepidiformaceae bacterium]